MTLVDASVIIDYLRSRDPTLLAVMQSISAAICGVTQAEILAGSRHANQRQRLLALLDSLDQVTLDDTIWDDIGDHLATLRASGITVPFADAALSTLAIALDVEVWSHDQHFPLIKSVFPALKLLQEPPLDHPKYRNDCLPNPFSAVVTSDRSNCLTPLRLLFATRSASAARWLDVLCRMHRSSPLRHVLLGLGHGHSQRIR